jgi:lipopolysaccharide transport system ATP-binding protein
MSGEPSLTGRGAIRAEALSKRYRIRGYRERHPTLRFAMAEAVSRRLGRRAPETLVGRAAGIVWALKDVSFEVEPGEVVAVIGRNGAGKSTLLKVLTRITEPTSGWAEIGGRVGSLLEVGTGFHPELTGRENISLHGAILGMRRREIERRFDEIVSFAEIGPFLDTPIKRYSSGMVVRLAFAVSAHFEADILLVDEVLAVGDVAYQKKCLTKMSEVANEGRTILFVSHNMATLLALCERGMLLENGALRTQGPMAEVVSVYLSDLEQSVSESLLERTDRQGWQQVKLSSVRVSGANGAVLVTGQPARFAFEVVGEHPVTGCAFTIYNYVGHPVATLTTALSAPGDSYQAELENECVCEVEALPLVPGRYRIDVEVRANGQVQDRIQGAAMFDVEEGTFAGRPVARDGKPGDLVLEYRWTLPGRSREVL